MVKSESLKAITSAFTQEFEAEPVKVVVFTYEPYYLPGPILYASYVLGEREVNFCQLDPHKSRNVIEICRALGTAIETELADFYRYS